ncbi:MAG: DUF1761 family protein [Rhizobiales bacterium]|nr:DUF1761 family protein [Hyphomicrobiales bacterium]
MSGVGINYWAVLVSAIAAWLLGAAYYMALAKPWMAAHGWNNEADMLGPTGKTSPIPFITSFVAELIMAWMLAGILFHVGKGAFTIMNGIISAFLIWAGFVATTISVNYAFSKKPPMLIAIDAGHWLAVLLLMGIILGAWGV